MSQRFIVTKEHRRFTEFADAVRRGHTIGLWFPPNRGGFGYAASPAGTAVLVS